MATPRARLLAPVLMLAIGACSSAGAGKLIVVNNTTLLSYENDRRAAPPAEGESLRPGPRIDRSLIAGKVAVVHFWGSWCGPCRREQPVFEAVWKRYRARGVQFLGVDTRRDQRAAALAFWDEFGVTYPSIYDPDSTLAFAWRVPNMPATMVVDREGKIAAMFIGAADDEHAIAKILDEELAR